MTLTHRKTTLVEDLTRKKVTGTRAHRHVAKKNDSAKTFSNSYFFKQVQLGFLCPN